MAVESFWRVATRPKWILALLAALALAAVFALLSQWQIGRSFRTVGQTTTQQATFEPIDSLATPGEGFRENSDARQVSIECSLRSYSPVIVANRLQDGNSGFWLIDSCMTKAGVVAITADAWFATESAAKAARLELKNRVYIMDMEYRTYKGWLIGPEAPEPAREGSYLFNSLSIAQLVNVFWTDQPMKVYPGIVALNAVPEQGLGDAKPIKIGTQQQAVELNFLNIFYAIEWVVFAGFAIFMWWRLVQDERLGLRADDTQQPSGKR